MTYNGTMPATSNATQGNFLIGNNSNWNLEWLGNITEVAIWGKALSLSKIQRIYNDGVPLNLSSLEPRNWWRMGDGDTHPTIKDHGIESNDGTMTNMGSGDITADTP